MLRNLPARASQWQAGARQAGQWQAGLRILKITCNKKLDIILFCYANGHENRFLQIPFLETFEKCSILFEVKESENFNRRNTRSISRIKI